MNNQEILERYNFAVQDDYTAKEIADSLGLNLRTIQRKIQSGALQTNGNKKGNSQLINQDELIRFLESDSWNRSGNHKQYLDTAREINKLLNSKGVNTDVFFLGLLNTLQDKTPEEIRKLF